MASSGEIIEKPVLVKPETVVTPGQIETALDDILKASEKKCKATKSVNLNPDFYVYRQKDIDEILPWDFIDCGVDYQFFVKEFEKAR